MKKLILFATVAFSIAGCSSGVPEGTAQDKANLDRLHRDGIGKVMADEAAKKGKQPPSLANPDGSTPPSVIGP